MKRIINGDRKLIRNGGRNAVPYTEQQLEERILTVAKCEDLTRAVARISSPWAKNSKVAKDLRKVEFGRENLAVDTIECEWVSGPGSWLGFHTSESGFAYLGCAAGGDDEFPVCFAIYFDGTDLRGYIPQYHNTYNTKTKKAFGTDYSYNCIEEEIEQYLGIDNDEFDYSDEFEESGLFEDIESRIQIK